MGSDDHANSPDTGRKILFNHIPKTGGITLRTILNRVYGTEKVFLIDSRNIRDSINTFRQYSVADREKFNVIAGHGAEMLAPLIDNPFRITTVREPISLFLSQYYYLKTSRETIFYNEMQRMETIGEYLDFATIKGQDNLLTRYLSGSVRFLADPDLPVPDLQVAGDKLMEQAIKGLYEYDAIIDVRDFNAGILALARKLNWNHIPVFRQANINTANPGLASLSPSLESRLRDYLRYDLALYGIFIKERLGLGLSVDKSSLRYRAFSLRQKGISFLAGLSRRK